MQNDLIMSQFEISGILLNLEIKKLLVKDIFEIDPNELLHLSLFCICQKGQIIKISFSKIFFKRFAPIF